MKGSICASGIAADHGGFSLKEESDSASFALRGMRSSTFGAHDLSEVDDYPDYVVPLAQAVAAGRVSHRGVAHRCLAAA